MKVLVVQQETISKYRKLYELYDVDLDAEYVNGYKYEYDGCLFAFAHKDKKHEFLILIDKALNAKERIDTLQHEYAHVLQNHIPSRPSDMGEEIHDAVFRAYYNKIVKAWNEL